MRQVKASSGSALERTRDAYREAAEEARHEQQALAAVHTLLVQFAEENLRLHQQGSAVIAAMRRDLERVRQQLRRLGVARR